MIYRFSDINNENMYNSTRVMIITGKLDIFNNIVTDRLRDMCRGTLENVVISDELLQDAGLTADDLTYSDDTYFGFDFDLEKYIEASKSPLIAGKWFCSIDYSTLKANQIERLKTFIKNPSENGILVVLVKDYKNYKDLLRNKVIQGSLFTHLIQLSFPNKKTLKEILTKMFEEHGMKIEDKALDLFIMKVNNQYNSYTDLINRLELDYSPKSASKTLENSSKTEQDLYTLTYSDISDSLKDVANYMLDDFIKELANPIKSVKIVKSRRIYKILNALLNDFTAKQLVMNLNRAIGDIIEMRVLINKGIVPVGVKFKVETCKTRIGEGSKLYKISDYKFMQLYEQAQLTSLKDWVYIKLLMAPVTEASNRPSYMIDDSEFEKVLLSIVNRTTFSTFRLLNDIAIIDSMNYYIDKLNSVKYIEK